MKDLKHLIYFENLLQEANNDLVQQARKDGKKAIAYTCYHIPEVLLNLDNCFSVRLRAPRTGSMDIATYYLSSYLCGYSKALLERAIEGGYNFLSALIGSESCSEMNRTYEHFKLLNLVENDKFFVSIADIPFKIEPHTIKHYTNQMQIKVLDKLHEIYGIDISDDAIRKAVEEHNEVCRLITEIGEYRKEENPRITGYEFHVINLVTYCCPKYLIIDTKSNLSLYVLKVLSKVFSIPKVFIFSLQYPVYSIFNLLFFILYSFIKYTFFILSHYFSFLAYYRLNNYLCQVNEFTSFLIIF